MIALAFVLGALAGACLPLQTGVNASLGTRLGSAVRVSLVSFVIGLATLCLLAAAGGGMAPLPAGAVTAVPWWAWLGGVPGVAFVIANILLLPRLGGTLTVVLPVLGQILMGMTIDALGLFRTAATQTGAAAMLGAGLTFAGVAIVSLTKAGSGGKGRDPAGDAGAGAWAWRVLAVAAGCLSACQTAVNGCLGLALASPLRASAVSFAVGTLCLVLAVALAWRGDAARPRPGPRGTPWWMWTGGVLGAAFVYACAWLAPVLGTGMTVVLTIGGATAGGLAVDHFGLFGARRQPVTAGRLLGIAVMVAGAALIRLG